MIAFDSQELQQSYKDGARVARHTIRKGVPRWQRSTHVPADELIHRETGLPVIGVSVPPQLAKAHEAFAKGHNDEILSAIADGRITVDFRPLLLTRWEVENAFETDFLGRISKNSRSLRTSDGQIELDLLTLKSKRKGDPLEWIAYNHNEFGKWPEFELFREPIDFALALHGRVLVLRSESVLWTRDVATTQILNRYI